MKYLLLCLLLSLPAWGVDAPNCYINNAPTVTGTGSDTFRVQVRDNTGGNNGGLGYDVDGFADNSSMTSSTDVVHVTGASSTAVFTIPNGAWGTGSINFKDGGHHRFDAKIVNSGSFPAGVPCVTGNGLPYTWNVANSVIDFLYPLYTSVSSAGATPQNIALWANLSELYSTGQLAGGGNLQYMVNGISLYDNGYVGYYGKKYGIPLSHVHTVTGGTTGTITKATMDTILATLTPALGADEQYNDLGWFAPFRVTGLVATGSGGTVTPGAVMMSVTSYVAYGPVSFTSITGTGPVLAQGQSDTANPMFLTSSKTPFTDYGIRPTFQGAYGACTSGCGTQLIGTWTASFPNAVTAIDASVAANGTNPTGGNLVMTSNGTNVGASNFLNSTTLGYGLNKGIAPVSLNVVTSNTAVAATFSETGLLGYSFSTSNINTAATPAFQSGTGYGAVMSSFSGVLDGSQNQTQAMYWPNVGAAFGCGSVVEPFGLIPWRYPDMFTMMSGYTRGMTAIEAAGHSMRDDKTTVCVGDPLNHPFSPNAAASVGSSFSGNIRIGGGTAIK